MFDTKQKYHAKLSASGSAKWLNCAGSIEAEAALPKELNKFAELGTLAHELADICLKNNQDTIEWIGKEISCESNEKLLKIVVDKEMAKFVQEYLDYVRSHETNNSQLYTEYKVDFCHVVPEGFGTLDAAVLDYTTGVLHIFDLKYGMTPVLAEGNTQARLYLSGLYNEIKFLNVVKSFKIHIVQPRKFSITYEEISIKELFEFEKYAKKQAEAALKPKAKRTPGEKQCEWCAARFDCPELAKFTDELTSNYFEDLGAKKLDKLPEEAKQKLYNIPDEKVVQLLQNKKLIEKFLKNIEEHSLNRLKNGEKIPGYKLVRKKSNRKWTDEAKDILSKKLGDNAYTTSLITITAAEKLLQKEEIGQLTYKPEGGIEIVLESDKREAISSIIEEFENVKND